MYDLGIFLWLLCMVSLIVLVISVVQWISAWRSSRPVRKMKMRSLCAIAGFFVFAVAGGTIVDKSVPALSVNHKYIKLTGKQQSGTVSGKTSKNIKVTLRENKSDGTQKKTVKSDNNGNFKISGLEYYSGFKLKATDTHNQESNTVKIKTSDIPDSAYTKFSIKGADSYGDKTVKVNSTDDTKMTGRATPNAKITFTDGDSYKDKVINADDNGNWSIMLPVKSKKSTSYYVTAKSSGLVESLQDTIKIVNTTFSKKTISSTSSSQSLSKKGGFKRDMNAYLQNAHPDIKFKMSGNDITFTAPAEYVYDSKSDKQALADDLQEHVQTLSNGNDLSDTPFMEIVSPNDTLIARSTYSGDSVKVYDN